MLSTSPDPALPALADLLGAGELASVEREVLGDQGVGEDPGSRVDQPPPGPALPVVEILTAPELSESGQVVWLAHNKFGDRVRCRAERAHPTGPVEAGGIGLQIGERAQVVGEVGVAPLHHIPVRGSQFGLQRHDLRGGLPVVVRRAAVHQREHPRDVIGVGGQQLGMLLVAIVGLVGQSETRLADVHQVAAGVLRVGVDVGTDPTAHAGALQGADDGCQRVGVGGLVDRGQLVEQWLHTPPFDGVLVEEAGIQVADALLVGARRRHCGADFGDQVAHLDLGPVEQRAEGPVGRSVGRDRVIGQPATVDMAEQVVLRAGTSVDIAQVDARADSFYRHATILPASSPG